MGQTLASAVPVLSIGAALIHLAVIDDHLEEYVPFGVFFIAAAAFQAGWALLAWTRPTVRVMWSGIVVNLAVLAVWVVSRTAGLPMGPEAGEPEAVAIPDVVAGALELLLVVGAVVWLRGRTTDGAPPPTRTAVVIGVGIVTAVAMQASGH